MSAINFYYYVFHVLASIYKYKNTLWVEIIVRLPKIVCDFGRFLDLVDILF